MRSASIPRSLRVLGVLTASGVIALACGSTSSGGGSNMAPASQQILRVNSGTEPNSWDPGQQTYTYEANVGRTMFNALLRPNLQLTDVEGLTADTWNVSSDGLTYTFHIRTTAKWSDGKPVTAADFVYGWQRLLDPALAAGYVDPFFDQTVAGAANYASIDVKDDAAVTAYVNGLGLSAPDDHTFKVQLQAPAPYFKWVATLWVAAPIRKDLVAAANGGTDPSWTDTTGLEKWAQTPTSIVGNGPFVVSEEVAKDHVTMKPNANAWNKPLLSQLTYTFISDGNTVFAKYQTGELDIIGVPIADTKTVSGDPKLSKELLKLGVLSPYWMNFNTQNPLLTNPKVRLALAKSIDRDKLCTDVQQGQCGPLQVLLPKGFPGYDPALGDPQKFDPAAAKQLLTDAGVTPAQLGTLKLLTRDSTGSKTVNTYIANQWQTNLGANIQLDVLDGKTVTSNIRHGKFDIYGPDGWGFDYPDSQDILGNFTTQACHSLNWGCWSNLQYDALIQKFNRELDATARANEQKQIIQLFEGEAPVGMIYQNVEWDLVKSYVHINYNIGEDQNSPGDFRYEQAYIVAH